MTCAVDTPIRHTFCWHLFLCCLMNAKKNPHTVIRHVNLLVSVSGWPIFITELYLVPDCGIDGSLSAPTFQGFELITLTRLSSFHFAVVRLPCFHFYRPFCIFFRFDQYFNGSVQLELKNRQRISDSWLKYGRKS